MWHSTSYIQSISLKFAIVLYLWGLIPLLPLNSTLWFLSVSTIYCFFFVFFTKSTIIFMKIVPSKVTSNFSSMTKLIYIYTPTGSMGGPGARTQNIICLDIMINAWKWKKIYYSLLGVSTNNKWRNKNHDITYLWLTIWEYKFVKTLQAHISKHKLYIFKLLLLHHFLTSFNEKLYTICLSLSDW